MEKLQDILIFCFYQDLFVSFFASDILHAFFHEKLDEDFFRKYCSISILFNKTTKVIKDNNEISGYRSQVLNYTISLFSDYTRKVTLQNLFNDGGFSNVGVSQEIIDKLNSK